MPEEFDLFMGGVLLNPQTDGNIIAKSIENVNTEAGAPQSIGVFVGSVANRQLSPSVTDSTICYLTDIPTTSIGKKIVISSNDGCVEGDAQYLNAIIDGSYMFYGMSYFSGKGEQINNIETADYMFSKTAIINGNHVAKVEKIISAIGMYENSKISSDSGNYNALINGKLMYAGSNISDCTASYPELQNGEEMFMETPLSNSSITLPKLKNGFNMFRGTRLGADSINNILESLPQAEQGAVISFTGSDGAGTCNPLIATEKGWIVEI